jgi:hypothetical protein
MAMKALILTLLLCLSCTQEAELTKDAFSLRLKNAMTDLGQLHEITWWVGKRFEGKITQSITFIVDLPRLKNSDLKILKERGVDAWIVRVIQVKGSESQDLGSLYAPFEPRKVARNFTGSMAHSLSFKIFYAAAFASERFRRLQCPAFGHDKRIESFSIKGEKMPLEIVIGPMIPYREKSQLVHPTPGAFNGGNELKGEFHLEIAPYNAEKKVIFGGFVRLPRHISVDKEVSVFVESCKGLQQEINNP